MRGRIPPGWKAAFAGIALTLLLGACGGSEPQAAAAQPAVPRHETVRVGDVTVRANTLRTADLDAQVAERYGIERQPGSVLLLVGVRRGEGAGETPIPARVSATVTDLRGQRQTLAMRELHGNAPSGGTVLDYFAVVETTPPDTLRFDIDVAWNGPKGATLRVDHELRPD
ncbi:MAG TPA: DUF4426 domain-containing protein [Xanthomonadaceae bacterium]|nr:DUF4426 domain-containing protein [Xanthomonadaceae bacterium]